MTIGGLTHTNWVAPLVVAVDADTYAGIIDPDDGLAAVRAALSVLHTGDVRSCRVVGGMVCVLGWWPTLYPERN